MALHALDGCLFTYGEARDGGMQGLPAFRAGSTWHTRCVVHIAGLTDGLLSCPWARDVAVAAAAAGWGFVQPLLTSSYLGYGQASLATDARELARLLAVCTAQGVTHFVLLGHSTGCQDIVTLMRSSAAQILGCVLVGPVSDREGRTTYESSEQTEALLRRAEELIATGEGSALMPVEADPAPVTAERFFSLYHKQGGDDMFSADLTPEVLKERLAPCSTVRTLVVLSTADEYLPPGPPTPTQRAHTLCEALGPQATSLLIDDNHTISTEDGKRALVEGVCGLLRQLG